ncbi:MAG: 2Fe-2S iron-sulfur cluster binding domain-containing protein [Burkholderiales bacterium]|nr:2Fe-2S iron-sulfur cluster binding domain-containing protein [Burkholderiales bacterium]
MSTQQIELVVNGETVRAAVEPRMHLGDFVRRQLGLTGTHLSCEHGVCGACTVLIDGVPQRSCITYAVACDGSSITTVEGYGDDPVMAAVRRAFHEHHALQCGYCTPGMLCTARDIVLRLPGPDARRVRHELAGNLCRCTGYVGIVEAIESVLAQKARGELAMPAPVAAAAPAVAGPAAATWEPIEIPADGDWIEVRQTVALPLAPDAAFARLKDLRLVANCLPGAEIARHEGERAEGVMNIRFGPITAAFAMRAELALDDVARTGRMRAEGVDRRSATRVKTLLDYAVGDGGAGRSDVALTLRFRLAGPLAQFSRAGLVNDYVAEMTRIFGANLGSAASGQAPAGPAQAPSILALLWARLRRLFG